MISKSLAGKHNLLNQTSVTHALQMTLATSVVAALAMVAFALMVKWQLTPQLALVAVISTAAAIMLNRSGFVGPGILLALGGIVYAVMHEAAICDGIESIGLSSIPVLIIIVSLLLGRWVLVFFTAATILATAGMVAIRYYVLQIEKRNHDDLGDFSIFVVTCVTAAVIGRILSIGIEQGLAEEKNRLSAVIASITDEVWFFDANKQLVLVNPAVKREFRLGDAEELEVEKVVARFQILRPDGSRRPIEEAPPLRALHGETIDREEEIVRTPGSGELRHRQVNAAPVRDASGKIIGAVCVVHDITERKQAEAALRESEERFRTMADTVPGIIFQNDAAGNATFFNKQATAFTGRALEQLVGYGWLETIHPDDLERIMASHQASLETPVMGQRELRLRRSDGQFRWMLVTSSPLFVGTQFTGYLGTIVDIADLKRSHGELLAAQKLESLGVLAGGIGHDFNNMLGAILAHSELVSAEIGDNSPAREGIEEIQRIGLRGSDTVRQLMAYAGQDTPEFRSVDLAALTNEMLQLLKLSVSKHARLDLDFPRDLPAVRANAAQIGQVVMNLVMNASEAIGERDGVISVRATRLAIGQHSPGINAASLPEGEYVRLEISDTGCGILEEIRVRIFDPFFTTKFPGRGLGLAVVQGIVRGHGGAITVVSSPGTGTAFEVYLPAADEPVRGGDAVQKGASAAAESAGPRRSVFVIEDEESLRNAVCKILRKKNFSVLEAEDGTAGVKIFRARHADIGVILLDLTIPGLSGPEVLSELTRIRPDVKIIVTTAYSQNVAAASLGNERVWAFIRKPYQMPDLIQLLHKSLGS